MRIFREFILENWALKLTSILFAWILWLFVRGEPGAERVITVPLEVRISRDMEITNERPTSVDITVRGTISNAWFGPSIPTCDIDLQGYREGEHVVPLLPENVRLPRASGLEVLKINPARITLMLERTISKEVPVAVPTRGEPASGYEIYGRSALPGMILITGPRSHVEHIQNISTEPISITGQKLPIRMFANLDIRDNLVRTTPVGPIEVQVILGAHRRLTLIPRIPIQVDDSRYATIPQRISVNVLVPVTFKGNLSASDLSATVTTSNLQESSLPARVKPEVRFVAEADPAIIIKDVEPAEVIVRKK
ncbi:MAG TPA: CdaR family protein [Acidobacteriota bacterium]|nr:CdaR family protein [Acidobacteriota bacterium]